MCNPYPRSSKSVLKTHIAVNIYAINTKNDSNWKIYTHTVIESISVTSLTYVISPVPSLSCLIYAFLSVAGRQLLHVIYFVVSDKFLPLYRHFTRIFCRWCGTLPSLRRVFVS